MLSFKPLHGFIAKMVLEIVDGGGVSDPPCTVLHANIPDAAELNYLLSK